MMNRLTISEVAKLKGVSRQRIFALIKSGRIPAEKVGVQWLIREREARLWQPQAAGRPRRDDED